MEHLFTYETKGKSHSGLGELAKATGFSLETDVHTLTVCKLSLPGIHVASPLGDMPTESMLYIAQGQFNPETIREIAERKKAFIQEGKASFTSIDVTKLTSLPIGMFVKKMICIDERTLLFFSEKDDFGYSENIKRKLDDAREGKMGKKHKLTQNKHFLSLAKEVAPMRGFFILGQPPGQTSGIKDENPKPFSDPLTYAFVFGIDGKDAKLRFKSMQETPAKAKDLQERIGTVLGFVKIQATNTNNEDGTPNAGKQKNAESIKTLLNALKQDIQGSILTFALDAKVEDFTKAFYFIRQKNTEDAARRQSTPQ
ncbi:MAG: hypothetical protein LBD01_06455 [Puniceicoccales bacterium]|nr:hypothetical protein [Puniceicoccales bacterium]